MSTNIFRLDKGPLGETVDIQGFDWKTGRQLKVFRETEIKGYAVSNLGGEIIKMDDKGFRKLKPWNHFGACSKRPYKRIKLSLDGKRKAFFVHALVADTFCFGKTLEKTEADHLDKDRLNNDFTNFEFVTRKENLKRRVF